jgi:hypothetical protein
LPSARAIVGRATIANAESPMIMQRMTVLLVSLQRS